MTHLLKLWNTALLHHKYILNLCTIQFRKKISPKSDQVLSTKLQRSIELNTISNFFSQSKKLEKSIKPLRVIRITDQSYTSKQFGRIYISGSIADVCAELDRLSNQGSLVH